MNDQRNAAPFRPFPANYRASGILLHVTSLPSAYGIGDVGPQAYAWVDRLHDAGQTWWQALPLGPTGYGNSPYQSLSTFAGNGLLISPDLLIDDGLLRNTDCPSDTPSAARVDFNAAASLKHQLLETAWKNFKADAASRLLAPYEQFCRKHAHWLEDYALFRALKAHYNSVHYLDWPTELVQREEHALASARRAMEHQIDQIRFAQFLLVRQGDQLKSYAHAKGIRLIGDLPFFVSPDSSDVWANPELFLLDQRRKPLFVGGVPPDAFSADGQLWGSPVYNWEAHRQTGYRWWIDRVRALLDHVDVIRLDHFRGFAAAWHIPADSPTARSGKWVPAPGGQLFQTMADQLGALPFIAEDLGVITPDVSQLRTQFALPAMRVLQFAFDGNPTNPHLPENFSPNTVVYTGTHDNNTSRGWFEQLADSQRQRLSTCLAQHKTAADEPARALIELAWSSSAALAMTPLQDVLNLGAEARMNVPGRADGNWDWRCTNELLAAAPFRWLEKLTQASGRSPAPQLGGAGNPLTHFQDTVKILE